MPDDNDLVLIQRVTRQDRQAFEVLYHRYYPLLFGYVAKFIIYRDVVEEVINDVMFVVWNNASRFNHTSRLSTWIFGIAYNKSLKALQRTTKQTPDLPRETPTRYAAEEPESALDHQELCSALAKAIGALSPEQRAVVELTFYRGFSYREVAEIVGCPVNTVKTRMFHARRRLSQLLPEFDTGYHPVR